MMNPAVKLPTWYRALAIMVGVVSIIFAFIVLADPALGALLLIFLLALALMVIGIDRLVAGISGHPYGWTVAVLPGVAGPPGPGPGGTSPPSSGSPPATPPGPR